MCVSSGRIREEYHSHDSYRDPIKANDDNIRDIVEKEINLLGKTANLNHIDVSEVTDMSGLFSRNDSNDNIHEFNGDIFQWDTHNVIDMSGMFEYSSFDGDIYFWDVSNVEDMRDMFKHSKFKGDISHWDVNKVKKHDGCFDGSLCPPANRPKFKP